MNPIRNGFVMGSQHYAIYGTLSTKGTILPAQKGSTTMRAMQSESVNERVARLFATHYQRLALERGNFTVLGDQALVEDTISALLKDPACPLTVVIRP